MVTHLGVAPLSPFTQPPFAKGTGLSRALDHMVTTPRRRVSERSGSFLFFSFPSSSFFSISLHIFPVFFSSMFSSRARSRPDMEPRPPHLLAPPPLKCVCMYICVCVYVCMYGICSSPLPDQSARILCMHISRTSDVLCRS